MTLTNPWQEHQRILPRFVQCNWCCRRLGIRWSLCHCDPFGSTQERKRRSQRHPRCSHLWLITLLRRYHPRESPTEIRTSDRLAPWQIIPIRHRRRGVSRLVAGITKPRQSDRRIPRLGRRRPPHGREQRHSLHRLVTKLRPVRLPPIPQRPRRQHDPSPKHLRHLPNHHHPRHRRLPRPGHRRPRPPNQR